MGVTGGPQVALGFSKGTVTMAVSMALTDRPTVQNAHPYQ